MMCHASWGGGCQGTSSLGPREGLTVSVFLSRPLLPKPQCGHQALVQSFLAAFQAHDRDPLTLQP